MTAPAVEAAVVVATFRRPSLLPRLIAALNAQIAAPPFEIVVVDDASCDDTATTLQRLQETSRVPLRWFSLPANRGPAAARNAGWRTTAAPVIAFTDDDCVPSAGWLAALVSAAHHADVVQGRTRPDPLQLDLLGPFSRTLDVPAFNGFFQTCNIAYRRHVLERVGGFDEEFAFPAGEDADLAYRALENGARAAFCAEALVDHDVRASSVLTHIRDTPRWASVVLLASKHPRTRETFHSRFFWRAPHRPAVVAAAGLGLAVVGRSRRARVLAVGLVAPYVRHRLVVRPLPDTSALERVLLLPAALAADLSEVAVLARASLRYRTLVL